MMRRAAVDYRSQSYARHATLIFDTYCRCASGRAAIIDAAPYYVVAAAAIDAVIYAAYAIFRYFDAMPLFFAAVDAIFSRQPALTLLMPRH